MEPISFFPFFFILKPGTACIMAHKPHFCAVLQICTTMAVSLLSVRCNGKSALHFLSMFFIKTRITLFIWFQVMNSLKHWDENSITTTLLYEPCSYTFVWVHVPLIHFNNFIYVRNWPKLNLETCGALPSLPLAWCYQFFNDVYKIALPFPFVLTVLLECLISF